MLDGRANGGRKVADDFELSLEGAEVLRTVAANIRQAEKSLQKELYSALARTVEPLTQIAREGADILPSSGGRATRATRLKTVGTVDIGGKTYKRRVRVKSGKTRQGDSLAERVRNSRIVPRLRGGRNPSLRLIATARGGQKAALGEIDKGTVRHPVFGNPGTWVSQSVEPGWWSGSLSSTEALDVVRDELLRVVADIARKMTR